MPYLFTSESVSEGHPDKVADQISDALIDNFLAFDPQSKVACETLVTTGQVVLAGEVKSKAYLDVQEIARGVIRKIGYTKSEYMFEANSCGILSAIHEQSADINQGVDKKKKEETLKVLERAAGFLQHEVGLTIKMRYTPKLQFELDDSLDKDFEISQVIRKIEEKDKAG